MAEKRSASDSKVQKEVERHVLALLSDEMGLKLVGAKLKTGRSHIELDGFWKDEGSRAAVAVEVFAHNRKVKSAQRHNVQTYVFKLSLARRILADQGYTDIKVVVVFVCKECAKSVTGRTWIGDAAKELGVTTVILDLPSCLRDRLKAAQLDQNLMTQKTTA